MSMVELFKQCDQTKSWWKILTKYLTIFLAILRNHFFKNALVVLESLEQLEYFLIQNLFTLELKRQQSAMLLSILLTLLKGKH